MSVVTDEWEQRMSALWAAFDAYAEGTFVSAVAELVAELPSTNAIGLFERACAFDSTGRSDLAIPLYDSALDAGLSGVRRRRAVIQMSSSLRNLGNAERAVSLLRDELTRENDALTGAVRAVLALALTDIGHEREAVSVAVTALAEYLPRYNRSMAAYALALMSDA